MIELLAVTGLAFAGGAAVGVVLARHPSATAAGTFTVKGLLLPTPKSSQWKRTGFNHRIKCECWEPWSGTRCKNTVCYSLSTVEVCTDCACIFINNDELKKSTAYLKAIRQGQLEIVTLKAIEAS